MSWCTGCACPATVLVKVEGAQYVYLHQRVYACGECWRRWGRPAVTDAALEEAHQRANGEAS